MKFDVCLMNPPYGSSGGDTLHLRFVDALYDITDRLIVVMPFGFVTKDVKSFRKFQERLSNKLSIVEEIDSNLFNGTAMASVGIYDFDSNHKSSCKIEYLNGEIEYRNKLSDISEFNEYEQEFVSYLRSQGSQTIVNDLGRLNSWRKQVMNLSEERKLLVIKNLVLKSLQKLNRYKYKYVLLVNRANGVMNARAITKNNGQIFTYEELVDFFIEHPMGIGYNGLLFDSKEAAENCKQALQRPLLRLTILRLQKDQNLTLKTYRYIPKIDWTDSRCLTDEGILELCGCPENKINEYVNYCKILFER